MAKYNLPVTVSVLKMVESSGNVQYFGRAYNKLTKESLDYCCAQTKHYPKEECLGRVWFEVGFLARFFGIPNSEIQLLRLDEDEKEYILEQLSINDTKESCEELVLVPKTMPTSVASYLRNSAYHWGDDTTQFYTPIYADMVEVASKNLEDD